MPEEIPPQLSGCWQSDDTHWEVPEL